MKVFYFILEGEKINSASERLIQELHRQAWERGGQPSRIKIRGDVAYEDRLSPNSKAARRKGFQWMTQL